MFYNKKLFIAIVVAALAVGGFGIFQIAKASDTYKEAEDEYVTLAEFVSADDLDTSLSNNEAEQALVTDPISDEKLTSSAKKLNIGELVAMNPDTVGWIYFKEGKISYPLMKDDGTNKYLKKTFSGETNASGGIFMPKENSPYLTDKNTIIYGHNMKDGSMFGSLKQIWRNGKLTDPYIYIYNLSGVNVYKVFAIYRTVDNSEVYVLPTEDEAYDAYIAKALKNNHVAGVESKFPENRPAIITLSTCYGTSGSNDRLVVQAFLYKTVKSRN